MIGDVPRSSCTAKARLEGKGICGGRGHAEHGGLCCHERHRTLIPHALPEPSSPHQEGEPSSEPLNLGAPVTSLMNGEQRMWCRGVGEAGPWEGCGPCSLSSCGKMHRMYNSPFRPLSKWSKCHVKDLHARAAPLQNSCQPQNRSWVPRNTDSASRPVPPARGTITFLTPGLGPTLGLPWILASLQPSCQATKKPQVVHEEAAWRGPEVPG